jgi:hypothetical protein
MAKKQYNFDLSAPAGQITEGKFNAVVYSGGILYDHPSFPNGVIFDLSSTTLENITPVLINHDTEKESGFSNSLSIEDNSIIANGQLLDNEHGNRIKSNAEQGFSWQLSPRIISDKIIKLAAGKSEIINGLTIADPVTIFKNNRIREISFTPVGVDGTTSANFFSMNEHDHPELTPQDNKMNEQLEELLCGLRYRFNLPTLSTPAEIFAEVDKLRTMVATEQAKNGDLMASLQTIKDETREKDVKSLFAQVGKEYSKEAAGYCFALSTNNLRQCQLIG